METLCKTCCNGMCSLQVTKDRLIFSCIEYIPGIMVGEIVDRFNKHFKKENEEGQMCEICKHYNNSIHWCSQYNDTTYSVAEHNKNRLYETAFNTTEEKARNAIDVQPVKQGHWIEKAEEYYRLWQDSGRSWDDMPYFVTGLYFACSHCFKQYDVNAEGVEEWDFCPKCGARMIKDGEKNGI